MECRTGYACHHHDGCWRAARLCRCTSGCDLDVVSQTPLRSPVPAIASPTFADTARSSQPVERLGCRDDAALTAAEHECVSPNRLLFSDGLSTVRAWQGLVAHLNPQSSLSSSHDGLLRGGGDYAKMRTIDRPFLIPPLFNAVV